MAQNRRRIRLGLLGSGTVGEAVQDYIFQESKGMVGNDLELEIVKVYTRNPAGKKWYPAHPHLFTASAEEVTDHPEIDIVIEALGSQNESQLTAFRDHIVRAFRNGKAVVTSDKAVLARFGKEIWAAAGEYRQELRFEACVGGGIPIIRSLTESFATEAPEAIYGIINGTCNYVLSQMERGGKSYAAALREAQQLGYAETNPKSDTSGLDAEAKLILLALVAFGLQLEPGVVWRKGIDEIHAIDFLYADRKGRSTIKHLAAARRDGDAIQTFVGPVLVTQEHLLAAVDGPTNAIFFKGRRSQAREGDGDIGRDWNYVFIGPGAGGGSTAVAILGDVCELARGRSRSVSGFPALVPPGTFKVQSEDQIAASFYVRFVVRDRAGIVGDICQNFGKAGVNISEIWQLRHAHDELEGLARSYRLSEKPHQILPFVITLERSTIGQIKKALEVIRRKDYILTHPLWFPIWEN